MQNKTLWDINKRYQKQDISNLRSVILVDFAGVEILHKDDQSQEIRGV